jgi:drug/metabolite transporter (DMT)-like permease
MLKFFPLIFVFLWSSAFITGKVIVEDSSPIAALCFRFAIVTFGFFLYSLIAKQKIFHPIAETSKAMATGILFHGIYLGGCWFSLSKGMPAGIVALIVTLQPILTSLLAGPLLGERVTWRQWIGIVLGFGGTLLVLGIDALEAFPMIALTASCVALLAITAGTLWQKKLSMDMPLSVNNIYQSFSASIFLLILSFSLESPFINFTTSFVLAMAWQIIAVSFGAFTILMFLIKKGSASKTSALFFLIPPVSAVMGWLFVEETLTTYDLIGLCIATFGVYIATRKESVTHLQKV